MKARRWLACAALLGACVSASANGDPSGRRGAYRTWSSSQAAFSCEIPAAWAAEGDAEMTAYGKRGGLGWTPALSVQFYRDGKDGFVTAQDFLDEYLGRERKGSSDVAKLLGVKPPEPRANKGRNERRATVGGLAATRFELDERSRPEHPSPGRPARDITVRNAFAVVPAEGGFYVLRYAAAAPEYAGYAPAFERLLKSFALKTPGR